MGLGSFMGGRISLNQSYTRIGQSVNAIAMEES